MTTQSEDNCAVCPFLGLARDPETHYLVPDAVNLCHQILPPQAVDLNYQERYCLTRNYEACNGYLSGWGSEVPADVFQKSDEQTWHHLWKRLKWVFAVLLLAAVGIGLMTWLPAFLPAAAAQTTLKPVPTSVSLPLVISSPTPLPTDTFQPTMTVTPMPTNTLIPSLTPGPLIETPMGVEVRCLVHLVIEGDSLANLAERYHTSVAVLSAINDKRVSPLWLGTYIVICPDQAVADGIPQMLPQFLAQGIWVNDLAAQVGVKAEDIKYWNGLDSDWIDNGRWVLIPQP